MDTTRGHIHEPTIGKQAVRIDRKSAYGNQFKIDAPHPDTGLPMTRDDVCDLFEERQLPNMDVSQLRGKHLLCWCKDHERCHGDSIIRKLNETPPAALVLVANTTDQLRLVAEQIAQEHGEIQNLLRKAGDRAKVIGQHLIDLMPTLKGQGLSLSDYCREFLPFGKTTAYDYIKIAKGETTWDALLDRKNSAGAEKLEDPIDHSHKVARKIVLEPYEIARCMGALAGMAWLYSQEFDGTAHDAAKALYDELTKGCRQDEIGESIAVDRVNWFLNFKEALDLAQVDLEVFLEDKAGQKLVA
jgi:hypothetical protein